MEAKKYVIFMLALAFIPALVFGYSNKTTHPFLTGEAIKLFENTTGQQLSETEKSAIKNGSIEEDNGVRWLEHFYDPVNNRGLFNDRFDTSKKWAIGQSRVKNGFSWDDAIYDYVYGDKTKGLNILGHVIHLLEDKTVPEHTRDDPHPMRSTYESYTKNLNSVLTGELVALNSIEDYFDQAASFTNANFFSDDTILKDYQNPKIAKEINSNISGHTWGINNLGIKIIDIKREIKKDTGDVYNFYSLTDFDNQIMADYWSTLGPKAVGYSAGVIKLFFAEVEKEKQTGALREARRPWWEKLIDVAKARIDQTLATVSLSSRGESDVPTEPSGNDDNQTEPTTDESVQPPIQTPAEKIAELEARLRELRQQLETLIGANQTAVLSVIGSTNSVLVSAGGETIDITEPVSSTTEELPTGLPAPTITSPADFLTPFTTTTITFSGTASASTTQVFVPEMNNASTTVGEDQSWTLTISFTTLGTTTINFLATDGLLVSEATPVTLAIAEEPVRQIFLESSDCDQNFTDSADGHCLILGSKTQTTLSWRISDSQEYSYKLYRFAENWTDYNQRPINPNNKVLLATGGSDFVLNKNDSADLAGLLLEAYDGEGNLIASTTKDLWFLTRGPIYLSEIGWAPTTTEPAGAVGDEWIELAHNFPFALNLAGLKIKSADGQIDVTLPSTPFERALNIWTYNYYLIERNNDGVISDISADLVIPFSATDDGATDLLTDTGGFKLKLIREKGDGEEIIDETPTFDRQCQSLPTGQVCWPDPTSAGNSIERKQEYKSGLNLNNWQYHRPDKERYGLDRQGREIYGTPRQKNTLEFLSLF